MKALANRGFYKKKLDTRFDTHCIKTGVQLCAVTEAVIQLYFSSVRVFKFAVGVFKTKQGYSNRRKCRVYGVFRHCSVENDIERKRYYARA